MATSIRDNTEEHLKHLVSSVQQRAWEFVNKARLAGFPVVITNSARTREEQAGLVRAGLSKTLNSLHLSGRAFDIDLYGWNRNNVPEEVWQWLGPVGESYGLRWGGRFKTFRDVGHFER